MDIINSLNSVLSGSNSSENTTPPAVELTASLDGMFAQVMTQALGDISASVPKTTSSAVDANMGLLGEGLAAGLLTSFYQSQVSNTLDSLTATASTSQPQINSLSSWLQSLQDNVISSTNMSDPQQAHTVSQTVETSATNDVLSESTPFAQGDHFSFSDALDVVNPLQHIPVMSYYYQQWTGDNIGYVPQVIGSTLFGGALGAITAFADIGAARYLGESPTSYVLNKFTNDSN